jgi:hypothetical protein
MSELIWLSIGTRNEPSGSIKCREVLERLHNGRLVVKGSMKLVIRNVGRLGSPQGEGRMVVLCLTLATPYPVLLQAFTHTLILKFRVNCCVPSPAQSFWFSAPLDRDPIFCLTIDHASSLIRSLTLFPIYSQIWSLGSAVGIATGYRLDDRGVQVRAPVRSRIFISPCRPNRL